MANVFIDDFLVTGRFREEDITDVYLAFIDAFSLYDPQVRLSLPAFRKKFFGHYQTSLELSGIMTYDGAIAGFILITPGNSSGVKTAWISAAGMRREYWGRGWMKRLLESRISALSKEGYDQIILEALTTNEKAIHIFSSAGFGISRKLIGYSLKGNPPASAGTVEIQVLNQLSFPLLQHCTAIFSFQEEPDFIRKERKRLLTLIARVDQQPVGTLVLNPVSGRIRHIFVMPEFRRMGIGRQLIARASSIVPSLKVINVDGRDRILNEFLIFNGFKKELEQFEMILPLNVQH